MFGKKIEQPPRGIDQVGEVVKDGQATPDEVEGAALQGGELGRHGGRRAQLQGERGPWDADGRGRGGPGSAVGATSRNLNERKASLNYLFIY